MSRWFETRYTPLGRLLGGLAAAAAIFATDPSRTHANVLLAGLFALYCVAAVNSARWHPSLRVRRRLPVRGVAGSPLTYIVEITNTGKRVERALVVRECLLEPDATLDIAVPTWPDEVSRENWFDRRVGFRRWLRARRWLTGATIDPSTAAELPPGAPLAVTVTLHPLRRGSIRLAAVEISRPDVLGIRFATVRIPLASDLLILPRIHPLARFSPAARGDGRPESAQRYARRSSGQEFHALREYRVGDPLKHIHWPASARRGQHVVKQFDGDDTAPWQLLLDPYAEPGPFEALIETAASLVRACGRFAGRTPNVTWLAPDEAESVGAAPRDEMTLLESLALRPRALIDTFDDVATRFSGPLVTTALFITAHRTAARVSFAARLCSMQSGSRVIIIDEVATSASGESSNVIRLRPACLGEDLANLVLGPDGTL